MNMILAILGSMPSRFSRFCRRLAVPAALCLKGAGACPPEDCGGIWGYADLLEALKDPRHPEHKNTREWLGRAFNPKAFDPAKVNFWLAKLNWPRVTEAQLRKVLMGRDNAAED